MISDDEPGVQPGEVNTAGLEAFLDEYPWTYQNIKIGSGSLERMLAMTVSRNINKMPLEESFGLMVKLELFPGDAPAVHLSGINAATDADLFEGCALTLTLDGSQVESFRADVSPDKAANEISVDKPARFIELLRNSNAAAIALPILGKGIRSFSFVTHSLQWPPPKA